MDKAGLPCRNRGRRRLVWSLIEHAQPDPGLVGLSASLQRVCRAVVGTLRLRGAAVHLMTTDGVRGRGGLLGRADRRARGAAVRHRRGAEVVAFRTHRPVLVPALDVALDRWPGFSSLALERGVRAVFSFPLQEGAVSLGALELYADRRGPLDPGGLAMAVGFARAATDLILAGEALATAGSTTAA